MFCSQCGAKLDDNARFCSDSGAPVEQKKPDIPKCAFCGAELKAVSKFCPACGAACGTAVAEAEKEEKTAAVKAETKTATAAAALPAGMTRDPDGTVRWTVTVGKKPVEYYMNEEKVAKLLEVREIKPDSKAKKAGLAFLDFVDAFGGGDSPYAELPSEMLGGPSETMYTPGERPWSYRYMIWIKGDRAHSRIRLYAEGSPEWLYVNPAQYDFVYHYITSHCPNVKIK